MTENERRHERAKRASGKGQASDSTHSRPMAIGLAVVAAAVIAMLVAALDAGTFDTFFEQARAQSEATSSQTTEEAAAEGAEASASDLVVAPPDPDRPRRLPLGAELEPPASFECSPGKNDPGAAQHAKALAPFSEEMYPCSSCHDEPEDINAKKRTLKLNHLNINLEHGPQGQWCYDCHSQGNRDMLQTAGDRLIPFEQSYELCGQCHGSRLKDWKLGIHGRRTGCWNGEREYLVCVHCHDPHAPKFKPLKPKPPPVHPSDIQLDSSTSEAKP